MKKFFIGIAILLIVILGVVGFYYKIEDVKKVERNKFEKYTYLTYMTDEVPVDEELISLRLLFAFDENDICVFARFVWDFRTEEIAKKNYQNWINCQLLNVKMNGTVVSFNDVEKLGRTKEEIKNLSYDSFEDIKLEY